MERDTPRENQGQALEFGHLLMARHSPLLVRRGGRDINKNAAKPPLLERTGWSLTRQIEECVLETWLASDHPVCGQFGTGPFF